MDARAKTVRDILHSPDQYLIPFFQRHYSWKLKHWQRLWEDVATLAADGGGTSQHFMGPLVCTPFQNVPGEVPSYQLIDGQQRMTTLTVLLAALRDAARDHGLAEMAEEVTEDYLIQKRQKDLKRYKVVPRVGDREVLFGVVDGNAAAQARRDGIVRAHAFFRDCMERQVGDDPRTWLRDLFKVVTGRLSLVVITITGENPYEIFESLNSTGLPLEESDLIRNYIFMQVPLGDQDAFNRSDWHGFEELFEGTEQHPPLQPTLFYRDYLMRDGAYSKKRETFIDFKEQARQRGVAPQALVAELKRFAKYDLMLRRPSTCTNPDLSKAFRRLELLEITTANPLLLHLLALHGDGRISDLELLGCVRDLESFVLRRSVCGESSRSYALWFAAAIRALGASPRQELQAYLLNRGWPDDRAFAAHLQTFALYRRESLKCRVILEALEESHGHKEQVDLSTLTIEHVMPQTIKDDAAGLAWQATLGPEWRTAHERLLHTLGNLTLSGYNTPLSNRPFGEKKTMLAESNLQLNKGFATLSSWDAAAITARGRSLSERVARLWERPPGDYVPGPIEEDERPEEPAKPNPQDRDETRRALQRYWEAFAKHLSARHSPIALDRVPNTAWASGRLVQHIPWMVEARSDEQRIWAGVTFKRPLRTPVYEGLKARQAEIIAGLGEGLEWTSDDRWDYVGFRLATDPGDESAWPAQHEWLRQRAEALCATLKPRIDMLRKQLRNAEPNA